jgi:hypothetical protein
MIFKLLIFLIALSTPLELDWSKKHTIPPQIPGYNYIYGDVYWDPMVYFGYDDLVGLETEIHLFFAHNKKIAKALLILGPEGLDDYNCIKKFEKVVSLLIFKYGKYQYMSEVKEPLLEDLLSSSTCYSMKVGSHNMRIFWIGPQYNIEAMLFGDSGGLYIEISYRISNRAKSHDKKQRTIFLKKLSKEL